MKLMPLIAVTIIASATRVAGQTSIEGGVHLGFADHRVLYAGALVPASGVTLGGSLRLRLRDRLDLRAEARGGRLGASAVTTLDDHDIAEIDLLVGWNVRPWLALHAGPVVRSFSNAVARQHWTAFRLGGEAHIPLAFENLQGMVRGYWSPIVHVTGLANPDLALAAGAGVEWRGRRLGVRAVYALEREDFGSSSGTRRLEELSSFQLGITLLWTQRLNPNR
jgi:hypothetical protein